MAIPSISSYPLPASDALPVNRVQWHVDAKRAVLLVHDMQDYFLRFYGADSELLTTLIANIGRLRAWADAAGVPVVYTAQPVEQSIAERALLNDMWGPGLTTADPALQQVTAALSPAPGDTVLVKWRYSAFQRSNLQELMRDWGRDRLRERVAPALDDTGFGADENLMDYGLDSLEVMNLVAELDKRGIKVSFEELAVTPTLNAWWALVERKQAA